MPSSPRAEPSRHLSNARIHAVCVGRVFLFATFMTVAATIPLLRSAWSLSAAEAGALVSCFTVTYAISLFGFAWAADHVGAKRMVLVSAIAAAAASAAFGLLARDWTSGMILYGLVGLTQGGVYTPLVIVFSDEVEARRRGHAMGWMVASTSIGYAVSLAVAGAGIALGGWPAAFVISGLLPAAGAVVLLVALGPVPNRVHARPQRGGFRDEVLQNAQARRLIAGYTGHAWEVLGLWAWIPAFLAAAFESGGAAVAAAAMSGAYFTGLMHLSGAWAALSAGRLSDRLGRRRVLVLLAAGGAIGSFAIGWLVNAPAIVLVPLTIVYSCLCIGDSPVLTTAVAEAVRPGYLGTALGWRALAGFGAGAVAPLAFGFVLDRVGAAGASAAPTWAAGFALLGLGGLAALASAWALEPRT